MIRLASDLALPLEMATEATAILARRGRGKTYTASVVAEELAAAGQPFVVLDPTGAWWGLRSSADGKKPGLEVTILGGDHGDVPLEPTAGRLIATFVVDNPGAYVLDLSGFDSNAAHDRFVTAFADRLYRAKASDRSPLTLIVDEADSFAPQRPMPGQQTMLGAFEAIVRRGRIRGLGCILITQRPAVLNKNVLTQAGLLVVLGITAKLDRDAIDDWVRGHATDEERKAVMGSLAGLDTGEAWVWWPTEDILRRIQVRRRRTFDSSATPKAGERVGPVAFAKVDLDELKDAIASTIEKAKAEDPALLRARIRELEAELRTRPTERVVETVVERVEVPVVDRELVAEMQQATETVTLHARRLQEALDRWAPERDAAAAVGALVPAGSPYAPARRRSVGTVSWPSDSNKAAPDRPASDLGSGAPARILAALAQHHPSPLSHRRIAALIGVKQKTSTMRNALSKLRTMGLVEGSGDSLSLTPAGLAAAGESAASLPTGPELLEHWRSKLGDGAPRRIFDVLVETYPNTLDAEQIAELAEVETGTSTFRNAMSKLRSLGLVKGLRADDDLMESIS